MAVVSFFFHLTGLSKCYEPDSNEEMNWIYYLHHRVQCSFQLNEKQNQVFSHRNDLSKQYEHLVYQLAKYIEQILCMK